MQQRRLRQRGTEIPGGEFECLCRLAGNCIVADGVSLAMILSKPVKAYLKICPYF
jgi:hypothetical protein